MFQNKRTIKPKKDQVKPTKFTIITLSRVGLGFKPKKPFNQTTLNPKSIDPNLEVSEAAVQLPAALEVESADWQARNVAQVPPL